MARAAGEDSANSQFFIMFQPVLKLDGKYTAIGRAVAGMGYVDAIERGEPPAKPSRIVRASVGADNVPPMPATALKPELPPLPAWHTPLPRHPLDSPPPKPTLISHHFIL